MTKFSMYFSGFDFTLDHHDPSLLADPSSRRVCGVLRCTHNRSSDQGSQSRSLTRLTVSKIQIGADGNPSGPWQQLASVTPHQPTLDQVSDGILVNGQLSDHQASLSLELTKPHDCQDAQFSCVAVSVDDQGRTSVKKSLVGKAVDMSDLSPAIQTAKVPSAADQMGETRVTSLQMKLDWEESRLEDSLKAMENRLEDKVGELKPRINDLENRLEDKMTELHDRIIQTLTLRQTNLISLGNEGSCDKLESKLDGLTSKVEVNSGQVGDIVTEAIKNAKSTDDVKGKVSDQLSSVVKAVKAIEMNLTSFKKGVDKLETAVNECTLTAAADDTKLTELVSSVASLSGLTQGLISEVSSLRDTYGTLEAVDEYFDPLHTGKKEWRLAFRGTAYNNVRVYPAYMLGTGIPAEVEQGCKQFNYSLPCVNHYRNRDAFHNWAGIDEVLFAIYKDGQMVKRVIFNGKGSTFTSWFAADRVIQSSWVDLTTQPHNYFSIQGVDHGDHWRRFFMNLDYDRSCDGFRGWFKATERQAGCPVEKATLAIPMFKYAPGDTFAVWQSTAAEADAFGIFLKYE